MQSDYASRHLQSCPSVHVCSKRARRASRNKRRIFVFQAEEVPLNRVQLEKLAKKLDTGRDGEINYGYAVTLAYFVFLFRETGVPGDTCSFANSNVHLATFKTSDIKPTFDEPPIIQQKVTAHFIS